MISKGKSHDHKERRSQQKKKLDLISQLPDELLHKILLNLTTKDSVKTSVLANRWRQVWKHVPGLDVNYSHFGSSITLNGFVSKFLDFGKKSPLYQLKLNLDSVKYGIDGLNDMIVTRGIQHLVVNGSFSAYGDVVVKLPVSIGRSETLVHLKLHNVAMPSSELASLPYLETMRLSYVLFPSDISLERLISSSRVLRVLNINAVKNVQVLQVRSQTLTSLDLDVCSFFPRTKKLHIDAPRLKSLHLVTDELIDIVINSTCSPKEMVIGLSLSVNNNYSRLNTFLARVSKVTTLRVRSTILKAMYATSVPLQHLHNLQVVSCGLELSLLFLSDCLNLKSLHLSIGSLQVELELPRSAKPKCLLTSLEFVKISTIHERVFSLVEYFLGNAAVLKELTIHFSLAPSEKMLKNVSQILKFPRLSSTCQVVIK